MYIILAIIAFGILVATHELGHFFAAKACGVRVEEYSIGMGPKLAKWRRGETEYALRLLPIGGYCAMTGENEDSSDPRAFCTQTPWKRAIILVAGALCNFITGFLLVLLVFSQNAAYSSSVVVDFMEGCPLEGTVQTGDEIWRVDGHRTYFSSNVSEYLNRSESGVHDLVVRRDGKLVRLKNLAMEKQDYVQPDGSTALKYGFYFGYAEATAGSWIRYSWYCTLDFVRLVWRSLGDLFNGRASVRDLSGPVGVVDLVNDLAGQEPDWREGMLDVAYLFALIAVNLAVMNLLPFPALDGGRVFLLLVTWVIECLTHRKPDPKYEGWIHTVGFGLLMLLMGFVLFNDVFKIIFNR